MHFLCFRLLSLSLWFGCLETSLRYWWLNEDNCRAILHKRRERAHLAIQFRALMLRKHLNSSFGCSQAEDKRQRGSRFGLHCIFTRLFRTFLRLGNRFMNQLISYKLFCALSRRVCLRLCININRNKYQQEDATKKLMRPMRNALP